jgi:hypothetical protein
MVTGTHPEDVDLFDYVEGDLPADHRATLEVHLASCAQCAEHVARVLAGRDALREAQFLQLPPRRREAIFLNLPARRAPARSSRALSPKRLLAVLVPVAAVAAAVVALVTTSPNVPGLAGQGGPEEAAGTARDSAGAESAPTQQAKAGTATLRFAGPADGVADELHRKGFDARVVGDHVEVRNATRAEVRRALQDRRQALTANSVKILIVP